MNRVNVTGEQAQSYAANIHEQKTPQNNSD